MRRTTPGTRSKKQLETRRHIHGVAKTSRHGKPRRPQKSGQESPKGHKKRKGATTRPAGSKRRATGQDSKGVRTRKDLSAERLANGRVKGDPVQVLKSSSTRNAQSTADDATAAFPGNGVGGSREELISKSKKVWERLRLRKDVPVEEKHRMVSRIMELFDGRLREMAVRHDTCRILQWMLKCGTEEHVTSLYSALTPSFVFLAGDKYGHHLALKLLRRASRSQRESLFLACRGHIHALIRMQYGADVLDFAYQTVASAEQKADMLIELVHGKEYALLSALRMKRKRCSGIRDALDVAGDLFRKTLLEATLNVLQAFVNKESSLRTALVHRACREYMEVVSGDSKAMTSFALQFSSRAVCFMHTKDGARFSSLCVLALPENSRIEMLQSLKESSIPIAHDEYGHMLLIALLHTVTNSENVVDFLVNDLLEKVDIFGLASHRHGRLILLQILAPFSHRYFHPDIYGFIESSSEIQAKFPSREEALTAITPKLEALFVERTADCLKDIYASPCLVEFLSAIVEKSPDTCARVVSAVASAMVEDDELLENSLAERNLTWIAKVTVGGPPDTSLALLLKKRLGMKILRQRKLTDTPRKFFTIICDQSKVIGPKGVKRPMPED
mmetsp:Transcript_134/g.223  ORF Transcript_134/g.223 Transcript_134/m.223 type:complete len:618 (-) Transcript_134:761-2614(-)